MSRFIHIDHCLCRYGGHEYDYAVNVLEAAETVGYDVVLATNRSFRDHAQLPARWPVYPVFPSTTYTKHCVWYGGHDHLPMGIDGQSLPDADHSENRRSPAALFAAGIHRWTRLSRRLQRRRLIHGFARACKRLFDEVRLEENDHVFFATITEFDILGLARYFHEHPPSRIANWHLQFHFGLYGGHAPQLADRGERRRRVRRQFEVALAHLPNEKIGFYNTTEQLANQYNQLNVGQFRYVPYPVSPTFSSVHTRRDGPLRVTCAGAARRDKRLRDLKQIVETVRGDPTFDQRLEVAAQLPPKKVRRLGIPPTAAPDDPADIPFLALPHPLERTAYQELIGRTDIGLFLHDKWRYYAQCSGVLHEMLAAGKPVIVPGGCWLADQIAEPISEHVERLCANLLTVDCLAGRDLRWRCLSEAADVPVRRHDLSFAGEEVLETRAPLPLSATDAVVGFRWANQTAGSMYVRLQLNQFDADGQLTSQFRAVVGQRRTTDRSLAVFRRDPGAVRFCLRFQSTCLDQRIVVDDVDLRFLDAGTGHPIPAGQVGLIAATPAQVPILLRDMVEHYPHYRESARRFSLAWCQSHHPSHTIEILTGRSTQDRSVAA